MCMYCMYAMYVTCDVRRVNDSEGWNNGRNGIERWSVSSKFDNESSPENTFVVCIIAVATYNLWS